VVCTPAELLPLFLPTTLYLLKNFCFYHLRVHFIA
jgi:hypothetical protein